MLSESPDKTIITEDWQIFLEKSFQHFIHHKKILKVTKTFVMQEFSTKIYPCGTLYKAPLPLRC